MAGQRVGMARGAAPRGVTRWTAWNSRYVVPRNAPVGWGRPSSRRCPHWPTATGSVNLGQGFPDTDGPVEVVDAAVAGDPRGRQPVPARAGHPRAARSPSPFTGSASPGSTYDPETEVLVTTGATEAIAAALLALVDPGDEVVVLEPYYDSYVAQHRASREAYGGRSRCGRRRTRSTSTSCAQRSRRARGSSCSTRRTTPRARCCHRARARALSPSSPSTGTSSSSSTRSTST